jgi:hypothetical protein
MGLFMALGITVLSAIMQCRDFYIGMLTVVMPNVVRLNKVAPFNGAKNM